MEALPIDTHMTLNLYVHFFKNISIVENLAQLIFILALVCSLRGSNLLRLTNHGDK